MEYQFESPNAETVGSLVYYEEAKDVKPGNLAMLRDRPCKITEAIVSKVGKHGTTKVHFVGYDVWNENRIELIMPGEKRIEVPYHRKQDYQVVSVSDDGFLSLMNDEGQLRADIKLPADDEMATALRSFEDVPEGVLVTVLSLLGRDTVVSTRPVGKAQSR